MRLATKIIFAVALAFAAPCWAQVPTRLPVLTTQPIPFYTGNLCVNSGSGAATTIACTTTNPVNKGDTAIILVGGVSFTGSSVATDKGSSCTAALDSLSPGYFSDDFVCSNMVGGDSTFTATMGGSATFRQILVTIYRKTSGVDVHVAATQTTPGTGLDAASSGSMTTTHGNDLIVGTMYTLTATCTVLPGSGFIEDANNASTPNYAVEHRTKPAVGAIAATFNLSNTSCSTNTFGLALKP